MPTSHDISLTDANTEVRKFLEIRDELKQNVSQLSTAASNFINSDSLSFVFHRDQLNSLFDSGQGNAYRIYFAADEYGAPTLVIVACTINSDETIATNIMSSSYPPKQYPKVRSTNSNKSNFNLSNE